MPYPKHQTPPHPPLEEKFCYHADHDIIHGHYESHWGSPCPKCVDYVAPERRLDPLNDELRRSLSTDASFHPALDDWYPCFHGGLVEVTILEPVPDPAPPHMKRFKPGSTRILVGGVKVTRRMVLECNSYEEAREVVRSLPCIIAKDDLISRGFFWD